MQEKLVSTRRGATKAVLAAVAPRADAAGGLADKYHLRGAPPAHRQGTAVGAALR